MNKFFWRLRKTKRKIQGHLPIIDKGDYRNTIFLAGSARSGTTWVADIINYDNQHRLMFEPFNPKRVQITSDFCETRYIRPDNNNPALLQVATTILNGNIRHRWVDMLNRKCFVSKRLIKDIRVNLFIKWVKRHFPEIPVIFLLRHPCAVALSRMKSEWKPHLDELYMQNELREDYLNPFKSHIENAESEFEKQIFYWCVQNHVPLKQFRNNEICIVFYENFIVKPEKEIETLSSFLGKKYDQKLFKMLSKPSQMTRKASPVITGQSLTESFKREISSDQIKRAVKILAIFGLDKIYGEDALPLVDGKNALMI